ncbi:FecR domain-containing protein [Sphingomonas sp. ZT3P38]|uniref:FecR family protein n=1 Tax=Parasphingomonas zepuensis TaxID=3096161 RepID=UPI002FC6E9E8
MSGGKDVDRMRSDLSRQATAWLVQLDNEPDDEVLRAQIIDWLATSPAHLAAWQETQRVSGLMSAVGPLSRARQSLPAVSTWAWFRGITSAKSLAAVALAGCLAWVLAPDLSLRLRSDEITQTAELRIVRLEDGSTVHLAPTTAIAFTIDARGRTLNLLQGEAWFDVAHDEARPFRVVTQNSTVTVLGTAFSVRKTDSGTDVAVQRGRVAVTSPEAGRAVRVELIPGQSVSLSGGVATRGTLRPDRIASWRDGVAIVNDQPIGDVIDRLRPWYKGYIVARGAGLKDRRVSGIYDLRDPDLALEALARAHKVTFSQVSPWLRIVTVR